MCASLRVWEETPCWSPDATNDLLPLGFDSANWRYLDMRRENLGAHRS